MGRIRGALKQHENSNENNAKEEKLDVVTFYWERLKRPTQNIRVAFTFQFRILGKNERKKSEE